MHQPVSSRQMRWDLMVGAERIGTDIPGGAWGWFPVPVRWGSGETARPGYAVHVGTDTPWVSKAARRQQEKMPRRPGPSTSHPAAGRLLSTEQVSGAIAYLASPLSGGTAVTVLAVDGDMHGLRLRPPARL